MTFMLSSTDDWIEENNKMPNPPESCGIFLLSLMKELELYVDVLDMSDDSYDDLNYEFGKTNVNIVGSSNENELMHFINNI